MARKTFISYKYSEAQDLRDKIIEVLGEDASYYNGETSDSADMADLKTNTIKKKLTDMMFNTSVLIVIISPNMKESKWIDWEIQYCLQNNTRKDRTSQTNGVVAIIKKVNDGYSWFKAIGQNTDGCSPSSHSEHLVHDIIKNNRYKQSPKVYSCNTCQTINSLTGSYISYVEEEVFLANHDKYIENAFDKSEKADSYVLTKIK
jgi:hypothetical protein